MKKGKNTKIGAPTLRRRAEERFVTEKSEKGTRHEEDQMRLLHELQVHQIELEIQNEELRRTQEELEASREQYFVLYDLAPIGYFTFDEKGLILQANLRAAEMLGTTRSALTKLPLSRFIFPEDQDIYYRHHKEVSAKGRPKQCELRLVRKDGTQFWARLETVAAEDGGGNPLYRIVVDDITEKKQAEEAIRKAHDEMEKRVVERTAQLVKSNKALEQQIAKRITIGEDLKESQKRLRNLTKHLQKIREQERSFLSRELHDELGQALTGMKIDIRWIERRLPEGNALILERLHSIVTLIDSAILSVQRISMALRPPALDDFGLSEAIRSALTDFEKKTSITYKFISTPQRIVLNGELTTEIFRIFQEAITNSTRHADAKNIIILLRNTGDKLTMEVSDDGRGITKKEILDYKSIGLMGMRERAYSVKGNLTIMGTRGKGTIVTLNVPLNKRKTNVNKTIKHGLKKVPEGA